MHKLNLSVVFGPVLVSCSGLDPTSTPQYTNTSFENRLIVDMMEYYQWLFNVSMISTLMARLRLKAVTWLSLPCL